MTQEERAFLDGVEMGLRGEDHPPTGHGPDFSGEASQRPSGPVATGFCTRCGIALEGKQKYWCSEAHRVAYWADRHPRVGVQARIEFLPTASRIETKRGKRRDAILARLRQGPATTLELMILGGAGFSSRIAELRKEYDIPPPEMNEDGGVYILVE